MKKEKIMIVLPTYNEKDNLEKMIARLMELPYDIHVLVVDDNSPDGTGDIADRLAKENDKINVLHRQGKLGLGSAYIAGFKWTLKNTNIQYIMEMDCDFSHDPNYIPQLVEPVIKGEADLVLGSRYVNGVNVVNWPLKRLLLSYFASIYTRIITGLPVHDATGGFKCFSRKVLEKIDLDKIKSDGYSFQIEMNFYAWKKGFRIKEVPIIFVDRLAGVSKMNKGIVYEAIWMVWRLRLLSIFGKIK